MDEISEQPAANQDKETDSDGLVIGVVVGVDAASAPRVSFPGCPEEKGLKARTTVTFTSSDVGRQVALMFEAGNRAKPLVIGKIQLSEPQAYIPREPAEKADRPSPEATDDGERLELTADREIVLRCGKASITLTRAGKIIIRGAYLLNRSSGVNKIKGASVQIN